MEDNSREDIIDLDLNQEPSESVGGPVSGLRSLLSELETVHVHIEERIRQLEAVTSRSRQRQRLGQSTTPQIVNNFTETTIEDDAEDEGRVLVEQVHSSSLENRKTGENLSTHLVEKALGVEKANNRPGSFFDCNICLDKAKNPVLTCCGHLFCWSCFYELPLAYSDVKECPACEGQVTDANVIPIYGDGNDTNRGSGVNIPPRPGSRRIESIRQQLVNRQGSTTHMYRTMDAVTQLIRAQSLRLATNTHRFPVPTSLTPTTAVTDGSREVSRLLLQGADSFSSLSSALNSAVDSSERLVEDLGVYVNNSAAGHVFFGPLPSNTDAFLQLDTTDVPPPAGTGAEVNLMPSSSSSSRRRVEASDVENGVSRGSRRRRLR